MSEARQLKTEPAISDGRRRLRETLAAQLRKAGHDHLAIARHIFRIEREKAAERGLEPPVRQLGEEDITDLLIGYWKKKAAEYGDPMLMRVQITEQLNDMVAAIWPMAQTGSCAHVDAVNKLLKEQIKLWGLDSIPATQQGTQRFVLKLTGGGVEPWEDETDENGSD